MSKWFYRIEERFQLRALNYLDQLEGHVKDDRTKIELMMKKTNYNFEFCEEAVTAWNYRNQRFGEEAYEKQLELF